MHNLGDKPSQGCVRAAHSYTFDSSTTSEFGITMPNPSSLDGLDGRQGLLADSICHVRGSAGEAFDVGQVFVLSHQVKGSQGLPNLLMGGREQNDLFSKRNFFPLLD